MKPKSIRVLTDNALVAALYVAVTLATASFAYLGIQFRIAEILILLVFFRKDLLFGVALGTLISNTFSPLGYFDVIFGTFATLISGLGIILSKRLYLGALFPIVINGLVVGAELYFLLGLPFWLNVGLVALGEAAVLIVGLLIFIPLGRQHRFLEILRAQRGA